jgi:hypothetical protein
MRRYDYLFRRGRKKGFNLVFIGGHGLAAFAHRDLTPPAGGHESALALTAQQSPLGVFHLRGDAEQHHHIAGLQLQRAARREFAGVVTANGAHVGAGAFQV